ncbi:hypothetical protein LXL04_015375 [Taraxacum kok-saghyz]
MREKIVPTKLIPNTAVTSPATQETNPWIEVKGRKHNSVFTRLGQRSSKTNHDQLARVTTTIYVANFPSHLTVKELWRICGTTGSVVDVFIGRNRNKQGQMLAFGRFIRVIDPFNLVQDLYKFELVLCGYMPMFLNSHVLYLQRLKGERNYSMFGSLKVPLESAYPFAIVGCFKDFRAIGNTHRMCQGEGFLDVEPMYLGGLWVLLDFPNKRIVWLEVEGIPLLAWVNDMFHKIASKRGELVFVDNSNGTNRFSVRLGVKTSYAPLVFESTFVNVLGVNYCISVRELSSWTATFITGYKEDEFVYDDGSDSEKSDTSSIPP